MFYFIFIFSALRILAATASKADDQKQINFQTIGIYSRVVLFGSFCCHGNQFRNKSTFYNYLVNFWCSFFYCLFKFINLRGFGHAIKLAAGGYDKEWTRWRNFPFQAISTACASTVGLGNIAEWHGNYIRSPDYIWLIIAAYWYDIEIY